MFSFAKFSLVLSLIFASFTISYAFNDGGQKSDKDAIVEFDGGSIKLSDVLSTIESIEKKQGYKLPFEKKVTLLNGAANAELLYKKALGKGLDKDPGVIKKIRSATKEIIVDAVLSELSKGIKLDEEEISEFYHQNEEKYFRPAVYNGYLYTIAAKEGNITDSMDSKIRQVANSIKQLVIENKFQPVSSLALEALRNENPELSIVEHVDESYYKGKPSSVDMEALEKFMQLSPDSIEIVNGKAQSTVVVLKSIMPAEKKDFSLVRNKVMAEMKENKFRKAYEDLIKMLRNEYHLKLKSDLLK